MHRYAKRVKAWFKRIREEQTEEDVFTRWEKDFELPPLSSNGLFEEYLELGLFIDLSFNCTCSNHILIFHGPHSPCQH